MHVPHPSLDFGCIRLVFLGLSLGPGIVASFGLMIARTTQFQLEMVTDFNDEESNTSPSESSVREPLDKRSRVNSSFSAAEKNAEQAAQLAST